MYNPVKSNDGDWWEEMCKKYGEKPSKQLPPKKVSKASKLQLQTLLLELGLIAKQWFRKVKVKIEVTK